MRVCPELCKGCFLSGRERDTARLVSTPLLKRKTLGFLCQFGGMLEFPDKLSEITWNVQNSRREEETQNSFGVERDNAISLLLRRENFINYSVFELMIKQKSWDIHVYEAKQQLGAETVKTEGVGAVKEVCPSYLARERKGWNFSKMCNCFLPFIKIPKRFWAQLILQEHFVLLKFKNMEIFIYRSSWRICG